MDNIEKTRKKGALVDSDDDSDSGSNHQNRKKKQKENDETLLDHLKKVENGEGENKADSKSSEEEESGEVSKKKPTKEDLFAAADKRAKEALLNSSDSDLGEFLLILKGYFHKILYSFRLIKIRNHISMYFADSLS